MASDSIPPQCAAFLTKYIDSIEEFEIILLLYSDAQREWTPSEVNKQIRTSLESANHRLAGLKVKKLVSLRTASKEQFFSAKEMPAETTAIIKQLEEIYRIKRFAVIELIFSKPIKKLHVFADAFKFRKE